MNLEEILRENGYRVTSGRLELLTLLRKARKPLTVREIQEQVSLDKVTLYRALDEFIKTKLITKVNLSTTAAYYEFIHKDHHHHHIICNICGKIEDIEHCEPATFQKEVLRSSKNFNSITSHSLEFFGICTQCSRA